MPTFRPLALDGTFEILPDKFEDDRGFFSEVYNQDVFVKNGVDAVFIQDNHSFSAAKGVLRGLHFQNGPHAQDKLVRVTRGRVYDVLVDLRKSSATYKKWIGVEVSADKWNQVFAPKGFAHGYVVLEENTELLYKVSDFYTPAAEHIIRFDDPQIGIEWPIDLDIVQLSAKDNVAPLLADIEDIIQF